MTKVAEISVEQARRAVAQEVANRAYKYSQELPQDRPEYLTPQQRQIIALHLQGLNFQQVAKSIGISPARASRVIKSAPAARIYDEIAGLHRLQLAALAGPAIEAILHNLGNPNGTIALKAADMILQTQGLYKEAQKADNTAEGVIQRMKEMVGTGELRVRAVQQTTTAIEVEPGPAERGKEQHAPTQLHATDTREQHETIEASSVPGLSHPASGKFPLETNLLPSGTELEVN